jgi:hypothetical protein
MHFAYRGSLRVRDRPDNKYSQWPKLPSLLPVTAETPHDDTVLSGRIKSNLELLRQSRPEKFTAGRGWLPKSQHHHINNFAKSDQEEVPFDLLEPRVAKPSPPKAKTSKPKSSKPPPSKATINGNGTCSRCGQLVDCKKADSLYMHERECLGKCRHCGGLDIPCVMGKQSHCKNCEGQKLVCSGRITHVKETRYCSRCEKSVLCGETLHSLLNHERRCKGKCESCSNLGIACITVSAAKRCDNCKNQKINCSGRITHMHLVKGHQQVQCLYCEGQYLRHSNPTHQLTCKGKCKECRERGIPCISFSSTGNGINEDKFQCVSCTEHKLPCSGRITHKTDKICPRYRAVPNVGMDSFSSHTTGCWGKCKNCAKRDLPCQTEARFARYSCKNCRDQDLFCGGLITYKDKNDPKANST